MAAYWSQLIGQLSTQRARWISQHSSKHGPSEHAGSSSERPVDQQLSPATTSGSSSPLERENGVLKLEIAELTAQIGQLRKILNSRAAQIQVLVDCARHLRLQQRRMTSLSSMDEILDAEFCDGPWLSLDEISSSTSSSGDDEDENELSAFFDGWFESDNEEKTGEEAAPVEPTGRQLGRSVSTPSTEEEQRHIEPRRQSLV